MSQHPNSRANLTPFKRGAAWNGNPKGGRRMGACLADWLNAFAIEYEDGSFKYTKQQIIGFANAPDDDLTVSPTKRIAAQNYVEMWRGGRTGREVQSMVMDRLEGKPPQSLSLTGGPEQKRIVLVDERTPGNTFAPPALIESDGESA